MKAASWIDRVKAVKGWESDYKVAKSLGFTPNTISMYRSNGKTMDETIALKVAQALEIDPVIILADQALERAKDESVRSAWADIIRTIVGNKKAPHMAGLVIGGDGGIRTLDEALHPILP